MCFFGFRLGVLSRQESVFRSLMDVGTICDGSMYVAWSVVTRQRERWPAGRKIRNSTGKILVVGKVLALVDRETNVVRSDHVKTALAVCGPAFRLFQPLRPGIRHPLFHGPKVGEFVVPIEFRAHSSFAPGASPEHTPNHYLKCEDDRIISRASLSGSGVWGNERDERSHNVRFMDPDRETYQKSCAKAGRSFTSGRPGRAAPRPRQCGRPSGGAAPRWPRTTETPRCGCAGGGAEPSRAARGRRRACWP